MNAPEWEHHSLGVELGEAHLLAEQVQLPRKISSSSA